MLKSKSMNVMKLMEFFINFGLPFSFNLARTQSD